jgi:hypothetical protein
MQVLRYRIGVFKGQKAMMAAIYGYPKLAKNLPGLVQIHGGGQYADYRAVLTNAKRGYATISIAWAGRINAPGYKVTPDIVKLFWDNKTTDSDYKITTDWGAVDGYHAPSRNPENAFGSLQPASWTLDPVESPRNNSWFLCTVGARRALTFLEQQPEIDYDKLGVYGHSMGGKLTVLTSIDKRVKVAAPSCGGVSDRYNDSGLYQNTIGDDVYLPKISCPIIFLSPSNDFHGAINDLQKTLLEIKSEQWRVICSPHHNHQDNAEYEVATQLWFDQFLKGRFTSPETPETSLELITDTGIPSLSVSPDTSKTIFYIDIYYTQHGNEIEEIKNVQQRINRFWHYAHPTKRGNKWEAELPLYRVDEPLWVYANVVYSLDEPVTGAGYYYRIYTANKFNLSSTMHMILPEQLKEAGVKATMKPSLLIESFERNWEKEWFTYRPENWGRKTHKVHHDKWEAPDDAKLGLEVLSDNPNKLLVGIDEYATEIQLNGGSKWQKIILVPGDFQNASDETLPCWKDIKEFRIGAKETLRLKGNNSFDPKELGDKWKGEKPVFKDLQWIQN